MTPEILSKLTRCKNPQAIDGITWEEVCWAKAHMARDVSLYADARYQQTDEEKTETVKALSRLLKQKVMTPRSGYGTGIAYDYELTVEKAHKLCDIALHQDLYSNICPVCLGKGDANIGQKYIVCDTCHGTGRYQYTGTRIAEYLQVGRKTFYRRYAEPYNKIVHILGYWDGKVYQAVSQLGVRSGTDLSENP